MSPSPAAGPVRRPREKDVCLGKHHQHEGDRVGRWSGNATAAREETGAITLYEVACITTSRAIINIVVFLGNQKILT